MSQSQAVGFLSTQIMLVIVQALKHTEAFAIEVKTRAENSDAPLETISGAHLVQANFQMIRTGDQITFLQSYLPEKDMSNFFYIKRNDLLMNVIKNITDHILHNTIFDHLHIMMRTLFYVN